MTPLDPFTAFITAQARVLRAGDEPAPTRKAWHDRQTKLRSALLAALGTLPDKPTPLDVRDCGVLKRDGYRIEKLALQTRPDVWMSASAYVPTGLADKLPAVLAVHGHHAGGRRDPVVQAYCLGLVKLGFFVLAVDAFGAGERFSVPASGSYHGALYGAALWPAGQTLLGAQLYDNRRAVDYLLTRPEVDAKRLGVTGASGGGNQSMYAGALDDRLAAVAPVCSVGSYQAFLQAACCVCEVLPGALRFTEEGDVLGLVAPRPLLVINATKDSPQFSVAEATRTLERTRTVYRLFAAENKLAHVPIEGTHGYHQPMREAMYGFMLLWLKNEGDGKPHAEPTHQIEKVEDLACWPDGKRPAGFLDPPGLAARAARLLLQPLADPKRQHAEAWTATAAGLRSELARVLGDGPPRPKSAVKLSTPEPVDGLFTMPLELRPEEGLSLPAALRFRRGPAGKMAAFIVLHPDGYSHALDHPVAKSLVAKGAAIVAAECRATGANRPPHDAVHEAADHNSAEHSLWIGRPLLGQWVYDVRCLLDWLGAQPGYDPAALGVVGLGSMGVVALCAAAVDPRIKTVAAVESPVTLITESAYGPTIPMALLTPGLFHAGDVPQLAALVAPRPLLIADGVNPQGRRRTEKQMQEAYAFTSDVYRMLRVAERVSYKFESSPDDQATFLLRRP